MICGIDGSAQASLPVPLAHRVTQTCLTAHCGHPAPALAIGQLRVVLLVALLAILRLPDVLKHGGCGSPLCTMSHQEVDSLHGPASSQGKGLCGKWPNQGREPVHRNNSPHGESHHMEGLKQASWGDCGVFLNLEVSTSHPFRLRALLLKVFKSYLHSLSL